MGIYSAEVILQMYVGAVLVLDLVGSFLCQAYQLPITLILFDRVGNDLTADSKLVNLHCKPAASCTFASF